jgi:hypothetical protein
MAINVNFLINDAVMLVFESLRHEIGADCFAGLLGKEFDVSRRIVVLFGHLAYARGGGDRLGNSSFTEAFCG